MSKEKELRRQFDSLIFALIDFFDSQKTGSKEKLDQSTARLRQKFVESVVLVKKINEKEIPILLRSNRMDVSLNQIKSDHIEFVETLAVDMDE